MKKAVALGAFLTFGLSAFFIPHAYAADYVLGCDHITGTLCFFYSDEHTISATSQISYAGTYPTGSVLNAYYGPAVVAAINLATYSLPFWWSFSNGSDTYHIQAPNVVSPGLIWNTGTSTGIVFTSSSTVDITSAFSNGGLSTTSMASFCDTNLPFDNSSLLSATLTFLPNGICRVGSFLVIPNASALNQLTQLPDIARSRFPFSYVSSIASTWSSLSASTTANSPTFVYSLHGLGLGSTTAIGNFLPDITVFSSSTVEHYFPTGTFDTLKTLAGIAIILGLFADIFFTTRNLIST